MSLINEALKRAKEAQVRHPVERRETNLEPVIERGSSRKFGARSAIMTALPLVLIALGAGNLWWHRTSAEAPPGSDKTPTVARVEAKRTMPGGRTAPVGQKLAFAGPAVLAARSAQVAMARVAPTDRRAVMEEPATLGMLQPAPAPPTRTNGPVPAPQTLAPSQKPTAPVGRLELQAIHFRLKNPSAIINGRTLYAGNEIQGAKVVNIRRDSVEVTRRGTTQVLQLSQVKRDALRAPGH